MNPPAATPDDDAHPPSSRGRRLAVLAPLMLALAGCASAGQVDKSLMARRTPLPQAEAIAERYPVACPDVLEVIVPGRRDLPQRCEVGADGRIDLGQAGKVRVEGRTPPQIQSQLAEHFGAPPGQVAVRVAEYRGACVYLFGEVNGLQRAVEYRGQETVLDLLRRVGGITPGAAPGEVYVVRSRITEGQPPEVFQVDLGAAVNDHDHKTNVRVEPFDQIHVGATRWARLARCLPPWLRPLFLRLCDRLPAPPAE